MCVSTMCGAQTEISERTQQDTSISLVDFLECFHNRRKIWLTGKMVISRFRTESQRRGQIPEYQGHFFLPCKPSYSTYEH